MKIYRQVFYAGRVQGVGFRYTVKQVAEGYEVIGWVRNLADGRVEVQAGGAREEVEGFLQAVASGTLARCIKEAATVELQAFAPGSSGFEIRL